MSTELVNTDRTSVDRQAAQAREAFEEKRTKECVALIRTILSADPENAEARTLEAAIKQQLSRDLNDARSLLEDSRIKEDGQKYRRAAEIVLLKVLNLEPNNAEAQTLLAVARGGVMSSTTYEALFSDPEAVPAAEGQEDLPFTIGASQPKTKEKQEPKSQEMSLKTPLIAAAVIVVAGILLIVGNSFLKYLRQPSSSAAVQPVDSATALPTQASPAAPHPPETSSALRQKAAVQPVAQTVVASSTNVQANVGANSVARAPLPPVPAAPVPAAISNSNEAKPAAKQGTLAVSSLIPAEIYWNNKHLGSTPTTLQLPAGRQTLDYRRGDLRTLVTHDIKSNETTTALITFETVVQINARPWAQVFVAGETKRPLGQTPLSDVRVPIGGVLVFENPNFPSKSHRVTEKETAIQVVFP